MNIHEMGGGSGFDTYVCQLEWCLLVVVVGSVLSSIEQEIVDYHWTVPPGRERRRERIIMIT